MVSKARLDLPEPDSPVNTMIASRGRSSETSLRLCSRAPRMTSWSTTAPRLCGGADKLRTQPLPRAVEPALVVVRPVVVTAATTTAAVLIVVIAAAGAAVVVVPVVVFAQLELHDLARHGVDLDLVVADELDVPDLATVLELEVEL